MGYWRYFSVPVIGNVMALLISSTVIEFLVVIANVGELVISQLLLILQVTKLGWLCTVFVCSVFNKQCLFFGSGAFNQHC